MPPRSQAQRAAMRSPEARRALGIPDKVAEEFNESDPGGKLPKHVKPKKKWLFSEIFKQPSAQGVHVATAIGNDRERKQREFNAVVASQSISTKRPKHEARDPDLIDELEQDIVRGVKPNGMGKLFRDLLHKARARYNSSWEMDRVNQLRAARYNDDALDRDQTFLGQEDSDVDEAEFDDDSGDEDMDKRSWSFPIEVTKTDADQRLVFGWASVAAYDGEHIIDKQGDIIPVEELEKAVVEYALSSRAGGDMHSRRGVSRLVESTVFTPEKEKLGLVAKDDKGRVIHGWWVGFKVDDDELWSTFKRGERPEFSIGGQAFPIEIEVDKARRGGRGRRLARAPF